MPENQISHPIAVASRTFSSHPELRRRLERHFSKIKYNDAGRALSGDELVQFLMESVGAIVALEKITDPILGQLPELKVISKYGVGLDNLDLQALEKNGIPLGWTGGVNARAVSELTLTFALDLIRGVSRSNDWVKNAEWKNPGGRQLSKKNFGIIGFGHIGTDLAKLLQPFGCKIWVHDILQKQAECDAHFAQQVSLVELLAISDIVSIHVPYSSSTHHLMDTDQMALMKPGSFLINTSRGNIVNESALLSALNNGVLGGAAADVFSKEPPEIGSDAHALIQHPLFIATPHLGGSSQEAVLAMGTSAIENLARLMRDLK